MTAICLRCIVSGLVQGVFYRRESAEKARSLGLVGYVKNLADDRVEVMICGEKEEVMVMQKWLWNGPDRAEVTDVKTEELPWQSFSTFEIQY
jgi:acylphosphatase